MQMAKKQDFKPDRLGGGLLSKLYLTKKQRTFLLKWFLYGLMLVVLSVLQDVIFSRVRVYGATTELVPCGIFLICVLEGAERGSVFALVASLAYLFSGTAPGIYAVVLITFLGTFVAMFRQGYLQRGFGTALLCTTVAMFLYELCVFAMVLFFGLTRADRILGFCITAGLSVLAVPVLYPVSLSIGTIGGNPWNE